MYEHIFNCQVFFKLFLEKLLKATYGSDEKPLKIGDIEIPCYVLENGQRVLSQGGMLKALGMSKGGSGGSGDRLSSFVGQDRLKPFISNDLIAMIESPIKFIPKHGGTPALGYDAETLQAIVRAVSKAYLTAKLQRQQEHIGKTPATIYRITKKENTPTETTLKLISRALEVDDSYWETANPVPEF